MARQLLFLLSKPFCGLTNQAQQPKPLLFCAAAHVRVNFHTFPNASIKPSQSFIPAVHHHKLIDDAKGTKIVHRIAAPVYELRKFLLCGNEVLRGLVCFIDGGQPLGIVFIGGGVVPEQILYRYTVEPGNLRQLQHIRQCDADFPAGNCLGTDMQRFSCLLLSELFGQAKFLQIQG